MIKQIILSAALLVSAFAVKAEEHYQPHISVGAHGGMSMSRVSFTPGVQQQWLQGSSLGVSIRYAEEKLVGVLAEFNYIQRGWSENFEESPLKYSRSLHYVSIPIMTHVYFGPPRFKCFFNLGPEFSFMLGQNTSSNFDYNDPFQDDRWPDEKRMTEQFTTQVNNKFDYGICAGFGCEYYLKPRNSVYAEVRYYYGLGNIFPSSKADTFSASRNMSLAVTLGYNFRIR